MSDEAATACTTGPRPLGEDDLPGCLALSAVVGWNQVAADWRLMLSMGRGWGIDADEPAVVDDAGRRRLIATAVVIPYEGFAWISMVLVQPSHRGRGHATTLMKHAIEWLQAHRLTPVLDATPAGRPVYRALGFSEAWGFRRYRREASPGTAGATGFASPLSRPIRNGDWPALLAADTPAFGADRSRLLRVLADRLPQAARVLPRDGRLAGYVFGRDGREAVQIGPLQAEDDAAALCLLDEALAGVPGPVYLDLADRHAALLAPLATRGFALQRPFTRMLLAAPGSTAESPAEAPGVPERLVLMAGPELG